MVISPKYKIVINKYFVILSFVNLNSSRSDFVFKRVHYCTFRIVVNNIVSHSHHLIIFYAEHIFVAKQEFLGKEKEPYVVITSYSIHYTKLSE